MSTSKHFDKICCVILAAVLLITVLFVNAGMLGIQAVSAAVGYASRLFNTSLTTVESYGSDRYSFKIEFDYYDDAINYYGLDKLCLNNIIQDNTYMKDYLTYQLMREFGADAPLCSYSYITVNGNDWGLYLAVEGIEDSFLQRCYGNDHGQLYRKYDPQLLSIRGERTTLHDSVGLQSGFRRL